MDEKYYTDSNAFIDRRDLLILHTEKAFVAFFHLNLIPVHKYCIPCEDFPIILAVPVMCEKC